MAQRPRKRLPDGRRNRFDCRPIRKVVMKCGDAQQVVGRSWEPAEIDMYRRAQRGRGRSSKSYRVACEVFSTGFYSLRHRSLRPGTLHVRKQFPRRQGIRLVPHALEPIEAHRPEDGFERDREGVDLQRYGGAKTIGSHLSRPSSRDGNERRRSSAKTENAFYADHKASIHVVKSIRLRGANGKLEVCSA